MSCKTCGDIKEKATFSRSRLKTLAGLAGACKGVSGLFSYPASALPDLTFLAADAFGCVPPDPLPPLQVLQVEYTRLFINSLPEVPCPPYGSIYLEGVCMASSTVAIRKIYQRAGIDSNEVPDHIAVEMAYLGLALPLIADCTDEQCADIAEVIRHLSDWTPEFFTRVEKFDRTGFYKYASETGRELVNTFSLTGPQGTADIKNK